jgi:basic membrane protein A and related proteins
MFTTTSQKFFSQTKSRNPLRMKMKKSLATFVLLFILGLILSACGQEQGPGPRITSSSAEAGGSTSNSAAATLTSTSKTAQPVSSFSSSSATTAGAGVAPVGQNPAGAGSSSSSSSSKVAIILPGPHNDGGWNTLGFEAVVQIRRVTGGTVDYFENVTPDKEVGALRQAAQQGYGLIITHGAQFGESIKKTAPEFPNTWFVQFNGDIAGPNFASVSLKFEDATYLAGMSAALVSKGDKFGLITGPKYPTEIAIADGFRQGLRAVNPKAELFTTFLNSWEDGDGGTKAASEMFDKGAELIFYNLNPIDQPVAKVAQARNKRAINLSYDLNFVAPNTVLTSVIISVPDTFIVPVNLWKDKKLEGKSYQVGLKEQALLLAPFRGKLSSEEEARVMKAREDLLTSKLQLKIDASGLK